jgi:hypothetical protein
VLVPSRSTSEWLGLTCLHDRDLSRKPSMSAQSRTLVEVAPKLSEFLALHALRETVQASQTGWHRYRSFSEQDYIRR